MTRPPARKRSQKTVRPEIADRRRIERYAHDMTRPGPGHLDRLVERTRAEHTGAHMMIGRLEGRLLKFLVELIQPRLIVEVGTFTGYSALCMAEALPPEGHLISCDIDPRAQQTARRAFDDSPFSERIELRLGPALETLETIVGPIDFAFIDAEKRGYADYYESILERMRPGGVIVLDNMLMRDGVLEPQSRQAEAIAELNAFIAADERVENVFLPVRDGIQLVRKR